RRELNGRDQVWRRELRTVLVRFFFSSRRRHTRWPRDWSSDVCSSDLWVRDAVSGARPSSGQLLLPPVGCLRRDEFEVEEKSHVRSEERRVGKECRSRWGWYQ